MYPPSEPEGSDDCTPIPCTSFASGLSQGPSYSSESSTSQHPPPSFNFSDSRSPPPVIQGSSTESSVVRSQEQDVHRPYSGLSSHLDHPEMHQRGTSASRINSDAGFGLHHDPRQRQASRSTVRTGAVSTEKFLHKCSVCSYSTKYTGALKEHMRKHTGEKPYSCNLCGYRSSKLQAQKVHMRTHTGEKPFSCHHCEYQSTQKHHLVRHLAFIHKEILEN